MNFFNARLTRVLALALTAVLALAIAGCGDSDTSAGTDAQGCQDVQQPSAKPVSVSKPAKQLDASKTYTATFATTCGNFSIKLDVKNNPITATSFANLVSHGVYDNTWFHRIIPEFVVQGGDPQGSGMGDAGYNVVEKPKGKYKIGTVAMAKGGADPAGSSSSQFYIVIGAEGVDLPPDYAIAGEVSSGKDVVDKIAEHGNADGSGTPTSAVIVKKATLTTGS
jgi:peptidyl-prolyl cis-trans isomerase B (cyclophilin B)